MYEYSSVEAFVQFCIDDEKGWFNHEDLLALNFQLHRTVADIKKELLGYGLRMEVRVAPHKVRGFSTSSNDRWFGPGSCKTHGGSGAAQICGWSKDGMIK